MNFAPTPPARMESETAMMATQLLTPSERDTLKRAGFENDPLVLHAMRIFNARIATEEVR